MTALRIIQLVLDLLAGEQGAAALRVFEALFKGRTHAEIVAELERLAAAPIPRADIDAVLDEARASLGDDG